MANLYHKGELKKMMAQFKVQKREFDFITCEPFFVLFINSYYHFIVKCVQIIKIIKNTLKMSEEIQ